MAYKTCPDCGSRIFEYGCVNCNERDYISMQGAYDEPEEKTENQPSQESDRDNSKEWTTKICKVTGKECDYVCVMVECYLASIDSKEEVK